MTDTPTRIPHDGGACPVSPGTRVRVWLRCGEVHDRDLAGEWADESPQSDLWRHDVTGPSESDIIAYAILEPDWAIEGPKLAEALRDLVEASEGDYGEYKSTLAVNASRNKARTALSRIKGEEG